MGDLGCDWFCDGCGACLNDQPGFSAGNSWTCTECGEINDVTENNILDLDADDGYVGSYEFYLDEEKRQREEEEDDFELGLVDDD